MLLFSIFFLLVFVCFWSFACFPCFFGIFLQFCFIFLSVFSVFFDFVVFSLRILMYSVWFHVLLQSWACPPPFCYYVLQFWDFAFSFQTAMLLSFRYIWWFGMTNKQTNLTHSVHQARSFLRCILHNYFRHCSTCLLRSSICPFYFSRLICHNIHCVFSFYQANFTTKSQTSNNEQQKTTRNNII